MAYYYQQARGRTATVGASHKVGAMIAAGARRQRERDAQLKRQAIDIDLRESAQRQADVMRMAADIRRQQSVQSSAAYQKNLAESQARTAAATSQAQAYLNPWRQAGTDALGRLQEKIAAGPGEFEESPGYQFRQEEAQKAVERSAAARGGVLSGRAIKEAQRYSQQLATEDYDNFLRRYYESLQPLERMSGQGMTASTQMGNIGMTGAQRMADEGYRGTRAIAEEGRYGADVYATGQESAADIMARQEEAKAERDYGYLAWRAGEDF